ncbi:MAG TPA: hypothetical protein VID26_13410 [Candidatus Limnocylindrales bacterium]|jgi:hypothetical protein
MIQATWRDRFRLAALAAVAFVLAHDTVFLLTDGGSFGLALARTGHGDQWTGTVIVVAGLALALAVAGAFRLVGLSRLARELDAGDLSVHEGRIADLAGHLLRAWLLILPVALALFVVVENLEHVSVGLPAPGLAVLGSYQYHSVLAVFAAVSFLAALVDALYHWRRDVLVARIAAARARLQRRPIAVVRYGLPWLDRSHASVRSDRISGRAPPRSAVA